jgi:N utilization substance protein A
MMREDQIPNERLRRGDFLKVLVVDVHKGPRGPLIRLSRTNRTLLRRLMEQEIPEVRDGLVEIKNIAREPGARSKAAVAATVPGIDPVGSCVGQRGLRIQNIVNELSGEKIDVVEWSENPITYITNALSPAKVSNVLLDEKSSIKTAIVIVPDKQLSLAIGKEGQNARLAAKLTGWRIDIKSESEAAVEGLDRIIAERAMQSFGKADDLLAMAERLLKGGGEAGPDRLWAAAQTLKDQAPAVTEAATEGEQEKRTRKKAKAVKPETREKESADELAEGLPTMLGDFPTFEAALALPRSRETSQFDDAFQRTLEAVQLTPEAALPSEAPFEEGEAPAPTVQPPSTTGDALPEIITADMLRARMAQRKEMDMRAVEIEIPEELLAGYKEDSEGDAAGAGDARGKSKAKAKKGSDKKSKKRWHPDEGDTYEDYF